MFLFFTCYSLAFKYRQVLAHQALGGALRTGQVAMAPQAQAGGLGLTLARGQRPGFPSPALLSVGTWSLQRGASLGRISGCEVGPRSQHVTCLH